MKTKLNGFWHKVVSFIKKEKLIAVILGTSVFVLTLHFINNVSVRVDQLPKVQVFDISGTVNTFEKHELKSKNSKEVTNQHVIQFTQALNKAIVQYAKSHRVILMPKEAVIAGAEDATPEILKTLTLQVKTAKAKQ